ncbi:hypothetical protein [Bartonella sp. CB169]|uniref:hypothetical protein n=1 Tax=Bartonella sp. CB169 TaxID=3112257 RepID=UPI00300E0660
MVKIFKVYVLNIFIAAAFFLSQTFGANANHLKSTPKKENVADYIMKHAGNTISQTVGVDSSHVQALSYETKNEAAVEEKIEEVVEPLTIGVGLAIAGYVFSLIGTVIGWIKDIALIAKT